MFQKENSGKKEESTDRDEIRISNELVFVETPPYNSQSSIEEIFNIFDANAQKNSLRDYDSILLNTISFDFEPQFSKIIHDNQCPKKGAEKKDVIQKNYLAANNGAIKEEQKPTSTLQKYPTKPEGGRSLLQPPNQKSNQNYIGCNCQKSQCVKMYCSCFKNGKLCSSSCVCQGCENHSEKSEKRRRAIQDAIIKNDAAFLNLNKYSGCQCTKTQCRKNYCECFKMGIPCHKNCRCTGCKNVKKKKNKQGKESSRK